MQRIHPHICQAAPTEPRPEPGLVQKSVPALSVCSRRVLRAQSVKHLVQDIIEFHPILLYQVWSCRSVCVVV